MNDNGWMSVQNRMPDDYVNVLTCDCKGNIHIMSHHTSMKEPFGIDRNHTRYYMVRYWMPLPKPPKKRVESNED